MTQTVSLEEIRAELARRTGGAPLPAPPSAPAAPAPSQAVTRAQIEAELARRAQTAPSAAAVPVDTSRMTNEEIMRAAKQAHGARGEELAGNRQFAAGLGQAAMQGATLGTADEIQSAIAGLVAKGGLALTGGVANQPIATQSQTAEELEMQARDQIRASQEAFEAENPGSALGANLVGGLATGGAILRGAQTVGKPITSLKTATGAGTAIGAAAGAGTAKEGERLEGAVGGAVAGGLTAGVFTVGSGLAGLIKKKLAPGVKGHFAAIAKTSGMTPAQIETRLKALGPDATLADVDEVFATAGDAAASRLGKAAKMAQKLIRRDERQFSRLIEPIKKTFGGSDQAVKSARELKDIRMQMASPLYEEAFATPLPKSSRLDNLLKTPEAKSAWAKVKRIGASDPDVDPRILQIEDGPSFRGWQRITEQLNDRAEVLAKKGDKSFARVLGKLRRSILDELDRLSSPDGIPQNSPYHQARALWSDTKRADDMLESGRDFFKKSADEIQDEMSLMQGSDFDFYRLGVGRAIEDKLSSGTDTNDLARVFRNQAFRKKAMEVFPSKSSAVDFINTVRAETIKKGTTNLTGRGSQTAKRLTVERQLQGPSIGTEDATKTGLINRALQKVTGASDKTIQGIGRLVLSDDPAVQREAIRKLQEAGDSPLLRLRLSGAAGANLAGQDAAK